MTDVIKRSRLKRGVIPRHLLRTAEPTVRGFYKIFKSGFKWSAERKKKAAHGIHVEQSDYENSYEQSM